jgi:RNA polymerase sigma-70 factor (ECF subfamily)
MRLPVAYRSTVILKDVLGYTVQDICDITEMSVPAAKSALHRTISAA